MKSIPAYALCALVVFGLRVSASAELKLPAIFGDRMVLQQGQALPVWGWADADETVTVEIAGQSKTATAGADGKWKLTLDPLKAGTENLTLTVAGSKSASSPLKREQILVGEVWLGSGQSNMAMQVSRAKDFEKEKEAAKYPEIRVFTVAMANTATLADDCKGEWVICSPEAVSRFSATAYFFGREIHREQKAPVGLIVSAVGGTPIESWIADEAQRADPALKGFFAMQKNNDASFDPEKAKAAYEKQLALWTERAKKAREAGQPAPKKPRDPLDVRTRKANVGGLFHGMVAPLIPYGIRGAIWYQGEANTVPEKAPYYQHQLPLLVSDWRKRWGNEFPFAWVQLPNFLGTGRDLSTVREGMLKTLKLPDTGMAITIDIGETKDIHPKNKQEAGRRLAQWALATVYKTSGLASSGPLPAKHTVKDGKMAVQFTHADGGLKSRDGELTGFMIAGKDQNWLPAKAEIDGDSVMVSNPEISEPVAVRYAWENDPQCNLVNGAGLPASPFRTDTWPVEVEPAPPEANAKGKSAK